MRIAAGVRSLEGSQCAARPKRNGSGKPTWEITSFCIYLQNVS